MPAVIGGAVGGVVLFVIVVLIVVLVIKYRHKGEGNNIILHSFIQVCIASETQGINFKPYFTLNS